MIKKYQKYFYNLPKNFFEAATEENPQACSEKPKY